MSILTALEQNIIYEVVITTYSDNNQPNASPMGILLDSKNNIIIKPFNESDTSRNLEKREACVCNFICDPILFVNSTLFQDELTSDLFVKSDHVDAPLLLSCQDNYIALVVEKVEIIAENRKAFHCKIIHSKTKSTTIQPYTRALTSLIEILIHSSRIMAFSKDKAKKLSKLKKLKEYVKHHSDIIRRVTNDDSIYQKLVDKINTKISPQIDEI